MTNYSKTLIIAEAGVNHNGSFKTACELINIAAEAKVDVIKFQIFDTSELVTPNHSRAAYQIKSDDFNIMSHYQMLKKLELKLDDFVKLKKLSNKKGLDFLCTPFDLRSMKFISKKLKLNTVKISSGDIDNIPLIFEASKLFEKIILSTGASSVEIIDKSLQIIEQGFVNKKKSQIEKILFSKAKKNKSFKNLKNNIFLLHCTSEYPAPFSEVNLNSIPYLENRYGLNVGLSDHTKGIHIAAAAVAKGAKIIEKHFTLDSNQKGPDHKASLEPLELMQLVKNIREVEYSLGVDKKVVTKSEEKNIHIIRKVIVADTNIKKGELFSNKNLTIKRAGKGMSPINLWSLFGKPANRNYMKNDIIKS